LRLWANVVPLSARRDDLLNSLNSLSAFSVGIFGPSIGVRCLTLGEPASARARARLAFFSSQKYNGSAMRIRRQLQYKALCTLEQSRRRKSNGEQWKKQCAEPSETMRAATEAALCGNKKPP
jgi:hypothetical protein